MKVCLRCRITKQLKDFSKDSQKKDGLNAYCCICQSIRKKEKRERKRLACNKIAIEYSKTCLDCGEEKLSDSFSTDNGAADGLNSLCRDCCRNRGQKYRWGDIAEPIFDPEKPARSSFRGSEGCHTEKDIDWLLIKQKYKCNGCGGDLRVLRMHVDHIIPICKGGTDWISNIQCLCVSCNSSKGIRNWDDWFADPHQLKHKLLKDL